jgi:hypothetical protein
MVMVNLLKKQKNIEYKPDEEAQKSHDPVLEGAENSGKNININRYHDPAGLSVGKMNIGFWLIQKIPLFKKVIYIILGVIGAVTWSVFFFTFGKYYIFDMRNDEVMFANLLNNSLSHEMVLKRMPKKLVVGFIDVISSQQGVYSYSIEVTNPNDVYWLEVEYYFSSDSGKTDTIKSFILPGETKILVSLENNSDVKPEGAEIIFSKEHWTRIDSKKITNYDAFLKDRINFDYKDQKFTSANSSSLSEKMQLNNFDFTFQNNSVFNFWEIPLNIFFYDSSGLAGISQITIEKIKSGDLKKISLTIPGRIGVVRNITIQPEINIFDNSVYMEFDDNGQTMNYE